MPIILETVNVTRKRNIGRLDHALRLPMAGRLRRGQRTVCKICGQPITDEFFIAGFRDGERNMLLHESCLTIDDFPLGWQYPEPEMR